MCAEIPELTFIPQTASVVLWKMENDIRITVELHFTESILKLIISQPWRFDYD